MKKLNSICLITKDVQRLRDYYGAVLQVGAEGDADFVTFAAAGVGLTLYAEAGMERMAPGCMQGAGRGGVVLEFELEDVDREYERLTRMSVAIVKPPTTQPWGLRSVWLRDPDGNIVNLYCAVAAG